MAKNQGLPRTWKCSWLARNRWTITCQMLASQNINESWPRHFMCSWLSQKYVQKQTMPGELRWVTVLDRLTGHGESHLNSRSPFIAADSTNCLTFWVYKEFISSHRVSTSILSKTIWHSQLVEKMWGWLMQWRWLSFCVCMQWIELATSLLGTNVQWLTDHVSTNKSLLVKECMVMWWWMCEGECVRATVWGRSTLRVVWLTMNPL